MIGSLFTMPNTGPERPWTGAERAAALEHCRVLGAALLRVAIGCSGAVNLLIWSGDAYRGRATPTSAVVHLTLLVLAMAALAGPGRPVLSRMPNAVGLAVLTPFVLAFGVWLGGVPGPLSFAWLFLLGPSAVVFVLPPGPRVAVTAYLSMAGVVGYLVTAGADGWGSAQLPTQLSFFLFTLLMCMANGHFVYWAVSRAASQRIRLAERKREVSVLHARLADRVAAQRAELRGLAEHLQEVQDQERQWLGGEIRSDLAPELARLRRSLVDVAGASSSADAATHLSGSRQIMTHTHAVFRRLLNRLHPMVLQQLGLRAALRWLADDAGGRVGVPVSLRIDLGPGERSQEQDRLVFLTMQDGLRRVQAWGRPGAWEVQVRSQGDGTVVIDVADDLIDGDVPAGAMVLFVSLREQVMAEGGVLSWQPAASGGGVLHASIPAAVRP
jgi:signal transduction histidine kinase